MEETFTDNNFMADAPIGDTTGSQQAANTGKAKKIAQEAGARAQQLKQAASEKAQQLRDYAGTKAGDLKEVASAKAQQFKQAAGQQVEQGRVKAREAHADAEEYIRQHPTKSVLTALGIGVVIGLVIRR